MADIIYTVNQDSPENIQGFEQYSQQDRSLVNSFQINNTFDPTKNYSELHILSLSDELLQSDYNYLRYKQAIAAQSAGQDGTSALTIDPIEDSKTYGYTNGGIKLLYHFLDDLYSQDRTEVQFYIQDISVDRTEISLATLSIQPDDLVSITSAIKTKLQSQSYFTGFRLNFKDNDLLIATNIDTLDSPTGKVVVVKLYEPLPDRYNFKSTLSIVDLVSDSIAYEIEVDFILPPVLAPTLRSANFNIDIADNSIIPTGYYNYNELFSYPINNSNSQLFSAVSEKGIDISIDYSDFSNFIHFSSAQERLLNFKYKLDLINSYSASLATIANSTTGLQGVSGSRDYYQNLLTGVVNNFDHYERFLYYESGSSSWPKSNTTKPYNNKASNTAEAITWYANEIANAISFDNTNYSSLAYSIPTYLRDDANNQNYLTFVYMVGQHFDNLWLYSKAVTDKYDADNRINHGISKDLVAEALENFGVKLYTSNKSIEDLFTTFIGQAYQSGSEVISTYVTGSLTGSNTPIQPVSYDDYQKEVQKRIYHNLPLLLKSKGTERGLRALINCLGIPGDVLDIKLYGGRNRNERPFYGDYQHYTSSLNKIRLDNTGSIVSGSTLSNYVSIIKRDDKYTDDLHPIEVGFSPTDNIDNIIISASKATASLANFNIDDYIGDPRNLTSDDYNAYSSTGAITSNLVELTNTILRQAAVTGSYNVQDYVRLIKFYDNTIFKMIKDFIPARAVADTGIIIKPYILGRSKAKSVSLSGSRPEYTASIDTAFLSAKSPNNFRDTYNGGEANTQYIDYPQTPTGIGVRDSHFQNQPNYNGEVSGSFIRLSNTDLNTDNVFKAAQYSVHPYPVYFISSSNEVCLLNTVNTTIPFYITSSTQLFSANEFFTFTNSNCVYSVSDTITTPVFTTRTFPRSFTTIPNPLTPGTTGYYRDFYIRAINNDIPSSACQKDIQVRFATCSMYFSQTGISTTNVKTYSIGDSTTNLTSWVTNPDNQTLQYTASWYEGTPQTQSISNPSQYNFTQPQGTYVTLTVKDPNVGNLCQISKEIYVGVCTLGLRQKLSNTNPANSEQKRGFEFIYSSLYIAPGETSLAGGAGQSTTQTFTPGYVGYKDTDNLRYQGIQGYFTNNGLLSSTLCQDPQIRYNIFKLTNVGSQSVSSTVPPPFWNLTTIVQGLDPRTPLQDWGGGGLVASTPQDSTFINTANLGSTNLYGPSPQLFSPIMLVTDPYNQINGTNLVNKDTKALVYAYVIQAYRQSSESSPSCIQTVVVYGQHSRLSTAEGQGTYPYFTTRNILVDWDYSSFSPDVADFTPIQDYGPWVTLKLRTYGTSPQTPAVTP